jgi:hypothetical protein
MAVRSAVYNRATLQRYSPCLCDYELDLAIETGECVDLGASDFTRQKFVLGALTVFLFFQMVSIFSLFFSMLISFLIISYSIMLI